MASLTRAFTKRHKRPEVSAPMPYREGQVKFSSGTIKRGKISGPVQLVSTTNMLAYNAPDLSSATSSSSSSIRSPDDSEISFSQQSFGTPITSPDDSSRDASPIEPNQASYFPKQQSIPKRSATTISHTRSSTSTTSSTDAPMVPRRALSHTKRSHQELARQRSLSRLDPPPLNVSRTPSVRQAPDPSYKTEAHPFGKELEQVNEVAEEFGGTTRRFDEEEAVLFSKGLRKFTVDDYLVEVNDLYGSIFDDQLGPVRSAHWL
jgi:hypothetical protein